jgi:hypothetical protein
VKYLDALCLLGVSAEATVAQVHDAYRGLARRAHPDHNGGRRDAWDRLQEAYQRVLEEARRPRRCHACDGTRQRAVMRRGRLVTILCTQCKKE